MAYGTAPRKINGVWYTRSGRRLSDAGQRYWENKRRQGAFDTEGHKIKPAIRAQKTGPVYEDSSFGTKGGGVYDPNTGRVRRPIQTHINPLNKPATDPFGATRKAGAQASALQHAKPAPDSFGGVQRFAHAVTDAAAGGIESLLPGSGWGAGGHRTKHGIGQPTSQVQEKSAKALTDVGNLALGPNVTAALTGGKFSKTGLGVEAALLPFGLGRLGRAAKGIEEGAKAAEAARAAETAARAGAIEKAGLKGHRALVAGEKAQQVTRARSRVAQHLVERPADAVSRALPTVPYAGERARVAKFAGREVGEAQDTAAAQVVADARAHLPKRNSDADFAHFWYAHMPAAEQNAGGLAKVKVALQRELDRTMRREPILMKKASKSLPVKEARVARLQEAFDKARSRPGVASDNPTVTRLGSALSVAKDELATAQKIAKRPPKPGKLSLAGLQGDAKNLAALISRLDRVIANPPPVNPKTISTLRKFDTQHTNLMKQAGLLEHVDLQGRRALVAHWLGMKPTGEEIRIHHAPANGKVQGSSGFRSIALGKPKPPSGTLQQNRLRLVRNGAIQASTHIAAEDLISAHKFKNALQARKDLWEMGYPFEPGKPMKGYRIVNPEGQVVPATMKADQISQIAENPAQIEERANEMLRGFLSAGPDDPLYDQKWKEMVDQAKATGVFDRLRVIPEQDLKRYYAQFLPAGPRNMGGRQWDRMIDATAASLIFARLGYIPKNILQALVTAVPHQGVFLPFNLMRTGQLIPRPGQSELDRKLWGLLTQAVSGGPAGAIEEEAVSKALSMPAHYATAIADYPLRVSAFLHEAAAKGVISRLSFHLSEEDKHALVDLMTKEGNRAKFNDIRQISKDAMGDFDRMTPTQRRWARRFLIVPGWLLAGTRYPAHFALTHPGRALALAYAAAGEPGAPKQLQVNKPIDEYLMQGLPSYLQAVGVGGGKAERVQSVLPGSLPFDFGLAMDQGAPLPTAAGYINPFAESFLNIAHSVRQTSSGETVKTNFRNSVVDNLRRLAPGEAFLQAEAFPGSVPSRIYPDHSRLGILARESGVVPIKIDRAAALRAKFTEEGKKRSVQVVDQKTAFYKKLDAAGYEPDAKLEEAYKLRADRAERIDKIHGGGLSYYQKAYKADVQFALELGEIDKATADQMLASLNGADMDQIKRARSEMTRAFFGGPEINEAHKQLRAVTG